MKDMFCMIRVILGFSATVALFFAYFTFWEYTLKSDFIAIVYGIVCSVPLGAFVYYLEEDELTEAIEEVEK
jgi:hypothetical protein